MSRNWVSDVRSRNTDIMWILGIALCLLVDSTMQEEIYFKSQPQPYHYSYLNRITLIQCVAVRMNDAGDEIPIAATPYRNSERLTTQTSPERHQLYVLNRVVAGVVVNPTLREDAGARYHCKVERDGEVVAMSTETHLLVGDGRPLVVQEVNQLDQSLYSVTLDWTAAPVPADSPILSYEISLTTEDQESLVFTVENSTSAELSPLTPGTAYLATVTAVNTHGAGNASHSEPVMTLVPEVPGPPTNVIVAVNFGTTSASIVITWTPPSIDPEVMTPLTSYTILYGNEGPDEELSFSVVVPNGAVSDYTVSEITVVGNIRVGVVATNSAGSSPVTYYQYHVGTGCGTLTAPEHGLVSQTGLDTGSRANYSCEQGFTLSGNGTRVCLDNGEWSGTQPTCTGTGCGSLTAPEHGLVSQTGLDTGSRANYSCEQGFTLSGNGTRVCLDNGEWSGTQPTCTEEPNVSEALLSSEMIIVTPVAIVSGLVLVVAGVIILMFLLRRRYVRMEGKRVIATGTFDNASPPLKRQKKLNSVKHSVENNTYEPTPTSHVALSVLGYTEESGTPTPPEPVTFRSTPSPPSSSPSSSNLIPSYSDTEDQSSSRHNRAIGAGFSNQLHSNLSPPSHDMDNGVATHHESCLDESRDRVGAPLSVQYSVEPRAAGLSPSPQPSTQPGGREEGRVADSEVGEEGQKIVHSAQHS